MSDHPHTRLDYPADPICRHELAFQLRIGRREPRVRDAIRDLGRAMRRAELEHLREWSPGELSEAWGK